MAAPTKDLLHAAEGRAIAWSHTVGATDPGPFTSSPVLIKTNQSQQKYARHRCNLPEIGDEPELGTSMKDPKAILKQKIDPRQSLVAHKWWSPWGLWGGEGYPPEL